MKKSLALLFAAVAALFAAVPAIAAPVDVTAVSTALVDAILPITTISSAILLILVALKVFFWIRRALA